MDSLVMRSERAMRVWRRGWERERENGRVIFSPHDKNWVPEE